MAMTGVGESWTSSTSATDFSRPTSNGATAPGNSTAFRIGSTASSSGNLSSSSLGWTGVCGAGFFFSLMVLAWLRRRARATGHDLTHEANHTFPGRQGLDVWEPARAEEPRAKRLPEAPL